MKKLGTRWINKKNFSRLGIATGTLLVLTTLGYILINGFVNKNYTGGNLYGLILDCFSLIFYFIVLNNYRLSEDNLAHGYYASLLIIISNYIFPLIMNFIGGVFNLTLIIPSITLVIVLIYFIFLTIENKKRTIKDCNNLKIVGVVTGAIMIASGIYGFYQLFAGGLIFSDATSYVIFVIALLDKIAVTIGLPLIFAFYPFVLYKERYI